MNKSNVIDNKNSNLKFNMDVVYKTYDNIKFFSLLLRYTLDCTSRDDKRKLFVLELDYFGFFEILEDKNCDQEQLIKLGIKLLFPFVKELVEDITRKGGVVPVTLNEVDFNLIQN
jgi:preprotein translocase subunit SecB